MKKNIYTLAILSFFFLLVSCRKDTGITATPGKDPVIAPVPLQKPDFFSDDEYAIYSAIIESQTSAELAIIAQQTYQNTVFRNKDSLQKIYPGLDSAIFSDFSLKNDKVYYLDNMFTPSGVGTILLAEQEAYQLCVTYDSQFHSKLKKKYPQANGSYLSFNRIGMDVTGTKAIVSAYSFSGPLNAGGAEYFLQKENGKWKIVNMFYTWVS